MPGKALVAAAALAAGLVTQADIAQACGPSFPAELLSQRSSTLLELQSGSFLSDVATLVPAPAVPYLVVGDDPEGVRARGRPEERALYDRGAAAFTANRHGEARAAFRALLALPADQRRHRSTWAAYMLGRLEDGPRAIAAYRQVRSLVADGFLDELGLAASSLGQEARVHDRAGDVVTAVHLYAEQAAHGHPDGAPSLRTIARREAGGAGDSALLGDPIGQRLLAIYLSTRADDLVDAERERLWREITAAPSLAGADVLAAAAYREGRWAVAGQLARRDAGAELSKWVLAKLALRDGDRATADRLLAEVSASCTADDTADRVHGERAIVALDGGHPVEAMAEAWQARRSYPTDAAYLAERVLTADELIDFVDDLPWSADKPAPAAATAANGSSAGDEATAINGGDGVAATSAIDGSAGAGATGDETAAIDGSAGAGATPAIDGSAGAGAAEALTIVTTDDGEWSISQRSLRELLARRLMREGRHAEAAEYFTRDHRELAGRFAAALERGRRGDDPIERARGLFDASVLARRHGLEILGTELAPDWGIYDANYDPSGFDDDEGSAAAAAAKELTAGEHARVAASAPSHPQRFHYRYLASALAEEAADLLPRRSHAFAATLCHATRYIFMVDEDRKNALYRRYIHEGPRVDFAGTFGQECPAPEFDRARRFLPAPRPSRAPIVIAVVAVALAAWIAFARAQRASISGA